MAVLSKWDVSNRGDFVFTQAQSGDLAIFGYKMFGQGKTEALDHAAMDVPVINEWIDDFSGVDDIVEFLDFYFARRFIYSDIRNDALVRVGIRPRGLAMASLA